MSARAGGLGLSALRPAVASIVAIMLAGCALPPASIASSAGIEPLPCAGTHTQLESAACWGHEARAAEAGAAEAFDTLMRALRGQSPAATPLATEAEQQWARYRDAHCSFQGARFDGGSAQASAVAICRWRLARARAAELRLIAPDWAQPR